MSTVVLNTDLVIFGLDLLVNLMYLRWPGTRGVWWEFAYPAAVALLLAAVSWRDPWAAGLFTADGSLGVYLAGKYRGAGR